MPRQAALLLTIALILWLLGRDVKRRTGVSHASWLVVIWTIIFASRPLSGWLSSGTAMTPDGYLEGNATDRLLFMGLIATGGLVLLKRRVNIAAIVRQNAWLAVFFAYGALSVLWSDYPLVAFKRWFKDFGNVVILLVLLTEANPTAAVKAVFARSAYLLVPLSFLFIRYLPEIGRSYGGWSGNDLMYVGVATHKNTLGALLMVSSVFLIWDLFTRDRDEKRLWLGSGDQLIVLAMCWWMLLIANSATSFACALIAHAVLLALAVPWLRHRLKHLEVYLVILVGLWLLLDSVFGLTERVVLGLGRDMTFTTRTDAWEIVLGLQPNPILGAGFKSFWSGERMTELWKVLPGIVQAHSGYVETYLNGGYIGVALLTAMMIAGFYRIKADLVAGGELVPIRLTFWIVALVYNFSEAAFNQLSLLWVVTLVAILNAGPAARTRAAAPILADTARPLFRRPPPQGAVATRIGSRPAVAATAARRPGPVIRRG